MGTRQAFSFYGRAVRPKGFGVVSLCPARPPTRTRTAKLAMWRDDFILIDRALMLCPPRASARNRTFNSPFSSIARQLPRSHNGVSAGTAFVKARNWGTGRYRVIAEDGLVCRVSVDPDSPIVEIFTPGTVLQVSQVRSNDWLLLFCGDFCAIKVEHHGWVATRWTSFGLQCSQHTSDTTEGGHDGST